MLAAPRFVTVDPLSSESAPGVLTAVAGGIHCGDPQLQGSRWSQWNRQWDAARPVGAFWSRIFFLICIVGFVA